MKKQSYEAPQLELIVLAVEQGFAASGISAQSSLEDPEMGNEFDW